MTEMTNILSTEAAVLRQALRSIAASVAIVTARGSAGPVGIAATSVTPVSMEPPALLVCVNRSTRLHQAITETARFRINYPCHDQERVADIFGRPGTTARFTGDEWELDSPGGPRLDAALAHISCRLEKIVEHGTHAIFIGAVDQVEWAGGAPLLYCNGGFTSLSAGAEA